jgi:hypothetical protein
VLVFDVCCSDFVVCGMVVGVLTMFMQARR